MNTTGHTTSTHGPGSNGFTASDRVEMQSHKDPEQLEREIDHQRDHITELVHALEQRMSPGQIFERVMHASKDGGSEFASNLTRKIKANPLPTLITAAGMLWLYSGHDQRDPDKPYSVPGRSHGDHDGPGIGERARQMREGASDKLHSTREHVGTRAHDAKEAVRDRAHRASDGFNHMLNDNPMAVGAMAIAVGALLGAMIPPTQKERELMGDASQHARDRARDLARDAKEKISEKGQEVSQPSPGGQQPAQSTGSSTTGSSTAFGAATGQSTGTGHHAGGSTAPGTGSPLPPT